MPPDSITPEEILALLRELPPSGVPFASEATRLDWVARKEALLHRLADEVAGRANAAQVPLTPAD